MTIQKFKKRAETANDILESTIYRQEDTITLEGIKLKYIPLSIAQSGIVYEILILGTQDSVSTPQERATISKQELLGRCVQQFVNVQSQGSKDSFLQFQLISQILLEPKVNELLYKLIGEVFPEIKFPHLLEDNKTMMLFAFIIEEFAKKITSK